MQTDWIPSPATNTPLDALLNTDTACFLSHTGLLACEGPDSLKFLQGQLTCNLQEISGTQARYGAHCTPKGRMVANFLLLQHAELGYTFRTRSDVLPALQTSLSRYIVFSKAKLRDSSADWVLVGLQGPGVEQKLTSILGLPAPNQSMAQQHSDHGLVICLNERPLRYEYWMPAAQAARVWQNTLATQFTPAPTAFWHWLDIREGLGSVSHNTVEEFIPQMLNMEKTGGISFTKGCYTGQEIVARAHYRGAVKKSMYRLSGQGPLPQPGDTIRCDKNGSPHTAGQWVIAEHVNPQHWEGLAVVSHDSIALPLCTAEEQPLQRLSLPYDEETERA